MTRENESELSNISLYSNLKLALRFLFKNIKNRRIFIFLSDASNKSNDAIILLKIINYI